ncbi:uncharacterized protein BCR38DRAFT_150569 [Pseudomassariella vexata]|uniref:Uncharacterized protein n=1 Tax=Pseudomassariella vexata TaxID=1141098 RepID=A0A1Y2E720_9PEZI|nr:uncharacterized protein BCR38DRAFT_150569 [Pseudomassariella vexata]ORY67066.1 hypothetical protein BCR38DRAFT_150569 [Pseudomassariella vexata]
MNCLCFRIPFGHASGVGYGGNVLINQAAYHSGACMAARQHAYCCGGHEQQYHHAMGQPCIVNNIIQPNAALSVSNCLADWCPACVQAYSSYPLAYMDARNLPLYGRRPEDYHPTPPRGFYVDAIPGLFGIGSNGIRWMLPNTHQALATANRAVAAGWDRRPRS